MGSSWCVSFYSINCSTIAEAILATETSAEQSAHPASGDSYFYVTKNFAIAEAVVTTESSAVVLSIKHA